MKNSNCIPWSLIAILSMVFLILALIGCTSSSTSSSTIPQPSQNETPTPRQPRLISNPASELNFTINDFPVGWQMAEQGESGNGYEITAVKLFTTFVEKLVKSWVRVFPSVRAADVEFSLQRGTLNNFRLESPNVGDDSYMYEGNATDEVLFRVDNVIARVTMFTQYGGSLKDVEKWAEKLESRIHEVRRDGAPTAMAIGLSPEPPIQDSESTAVPESTSAQPSTLIPSATPAPMLTSTPAPALNPFLTALAALPQAM